MCNPEPSSSWATRVRVLCNSARAVFVGVLFRLFVGCLEGFLQSTETGPNSEKNHESSDHEECLEFQLLVFQLFRSQCDDDDEAVGKFHRDSL